MRALAKSLVTPDRSGEGRWDQVAEDLLQLVHERAEKGWYLGDIDPSIEYSGMKIGVLYGCATFYKDLPFTEKPSDTEK